MIPEIDARGIGFDCLLKQRQIAGMFPGLIALVTVVRDRDVEQLGDGKPIFRGTNIFELAPDGRIEQITSFPG